MKRPSVYIGAIFAIAIICACGAFVAAQPPARPQPLSAEFLKRREAGGAFQLGRLYLRQNKPGSLERSIENFDRAADLYAELGDRPEMACAFLGMGSAQAQLGRNVLAAQTFQRAINLLRGFRGQDLSEHPLVSLGFLYDHLLDKRFLFLYDELSIKPPEKGRDRNGDRLDTRFSQLDEQYSVQYFNQPFSVSVPVDASTEDEDSRLAGSGAEPKPVSFYRDVLAIWRQNGFESIEVATRIQLMEAWADENPQVAVFYGKQAVNEYQELRRSIREHDRVRGRRYVNQLADKFRILADLLIGLGRLAEADDVLRMLKEEEYSDFVRRDTAEIERLKQHVRLTAKERQLIDRYLALATRAGEIGEQYGKLDADKRKLEEKGKTLPEKDAKTYKELSTQVADVNAAFRLFLEKELVNEIGTTGADAVRSDRDMQARVNEWGAGSVALYTVVTENRYRVILTTPNIQVDGKTEINAAVLNKKISDFRRALQDPAQDPRPLGKELYDILIKPIEKELTAAKATTLVWSLDGALRYIPMAALSPDGKRYMVESYRNVGLTPGVRDRVGASDVGWTALGVGTSEEQTVVFPDSPGERVKVDALPGTRLELSAIVRDESLPGETGIFDGKRYLDADFTLRNLTDSLARRNRDGGKKFTVVHVASHFRLGPNWSTSYLVLGSGKLLSLEEMSTTAAIDFTGVELVTLSACNTALLTAANGIEVDSLAEAIHAKSGKAVLATLWSVYDESTARLMTGFYRQRKLNPAMSKAEALQIAQLDLLRGDAGGASQFAHPYYWSGFVLTGNWR